MLLNHPLTKLEVTECEHALYASDFLFIVTLWLAKCSMAFLFLRLSPNVRYHTLASKAALLLTLTLMFISVFVTTLRCDLSQPWVFFGAHCSDIVSLGP